MLPFVGLCLPPTPYMAIGRKAEKELLEAFRNMDHQSQAAIVAAAKAMTKP